MSEQEQTRHCIVSLDKTTILLHGKEDGSHLIKQKKRNERRQKKKNIWAYNNQFEDAYDWIV